MPVAQAVSAAEDGAVDRRQDWGESPDVIGFVGRAEELATLRDWVLEEHCRLAAVLGMGGIGKTALASRLAQDAAPSFQRVYWRSLRDALPAGEWMAGAIGFLSDHHLEPSWVTPPGSWTTPITNGVPDLTNPTVTTTGTFAVPTDFASMQGYTFESCGHLLVSGDTTSNQETLTEIAGSTALGYRCGDDNS